MIHPLFLAVSLALALAGYLQERKILSPFILLPLISPVLYIWYPSLAFLLGGMIILIRSADFLIEGAVWIARKAGVPALVTGIVIIGLGTSMPELFVNLLSAAEGNTGLALGNVLGSNVANMGLVIGAGGLIAGTIKIEKSLISREIPIMLGGSLLMILLAWNFFPGQENSRQALSFNDGLILILGLVFYILYLFQSMKIEKEPESLEEQLNQHYDNVDEMPEKQTKGLHPLVLILIGVAGLYFGGDFIVDGAVELALSLGAGAMALGVIVGVGTSLPELAAAVSSARKGEPDLIVGNVVGSNIFNILLVLGSTALISPIYTGPELLIHFAFLAGMSLLFYFFLGSQRHLTRLESGLLAACGLGYLVYSLA